MAISSIFRHYSAWAVIVLALTIGPDAAARSPWIDDWKQWNAVSGPVFPGESWRQYAAPEEAGWSSEKLAEAQRMSLRAGSAAVMVVYNGAVLAKWGDVGRRLRCHSIRKSLLSALFGPAVSAGRIDLDETIGSLGIDDDTALTPTEKSATVSDLLKSRSGVYLRAAFETGSSVNGRPKRGSHKPGAHWYYNNWDFNVLATIYEKKTGGDVFSAFKSAIADPLHMQDFETRHGYYHPAPEKSRHPAYPFRMSARDLARFGVLFLNDGRWKDVRIIPPAWVRDSTRSYSVTPAGGFGYMWWTEIGRLDELGTFTAYGYGGHAVFVIPGARLVLVHRADTYDGRNVSFRAVRNILRQVLRARTGPPKAQPALTPLPTSPAADPGVALTADQRASLTGQYTRLTQLTGSASG